MQRRLMLSYGEDRYTPVKIILPQVQFGKVIKFIQIAGIYANSMQALKKISKPQPGEYAPYTIMYIGLLPDDGMLLTHLQLNMQMVKQLVLALPEDKLLYRYAPGKWTIKEILVHITDDERIYAYRSLCFARNDKTALPGFEQDDYALYSKANERNIGNILEEYETVRRATISLFNSMDEEMLQRTGIANENTSSVRALAYHIAGHELHHINVINQKYLTL
jgi:uncharacterized damage-inducible protein DinB